MSSKDRKNMQLQRKNKTMGDQLELMGNQVRNGIKRVTNSITMAVRATFDRIRSVVTRSKARFSKAIPRAKNRVQGILETAVAKVKQIKSIDTLKSTMAEIKQQIQDGELLKSFRSKKEFLKLLQPIQRRYQELILKIKGNRAAAAKKPESKLWMELTGMTKQEIQLKAAEEMRFIMINSTFSNASAKDIINKSNSTGAITDADSNSFREKAMREMEYFTDYVTGGFYARSKIRRKINKISDGAKRQPKKEEPKTWKEHIFGRASTKENIE